MSESSANGGITPTIAPDSPDSPVNAVARLRSAVGQFAARVRGGLQLPNLAPRLRGLLGPLQTVNGRVPEDEDTDAENSRLTELAERLGTKPILHEDDLKYQGTQPLDDRDKAMLEWVRRNAKEQLCIRVRRNVGNPVAWVITNNPDLAEVETACGWLKLKGWEVEVRPATRTVVKSAVERDAALSPTVVEEQFRQLLRDALNANASDIHFELRGDRGSTRFRVNGEMQEVTRGDQQPRFPREMIEQFGNYMFNRLAKRGARQFVTNMALNASAQMKVDDAAVALRFSTAPDIRGVDIFVRVWRPDKEALALHDLGYEEEHINLLNQAIHKPYGVILFSGPTGSGKSSSLTALLDSLDDAEKERRKIVSLEEPVERELSHVTHVSVSAITAHGGWEALLGGLNRWDSNINVLGEIKDAESAKALQDLATSGKLTLTTLHASNVFSIPARMEELGVNHQLLYNANFLVLLVNQRLVPKLCGECRIGLWDEEKLREKVEQEKTKQLTADAAPAEVERHMRDYVESVARYRGIFPEHTAGNAVSQVSLRGSGCGNCARTGIVDRVLVAEMIATDETSRAYIQHRDWDGWRASLVASGWRSIEDHVHSYIAIGDVDPADVERLVCPLDRDVHFVAASTHG